MKFKLYAPMILSTFILSSCGTKGGAFLNQALGIASKQQGAKITPPDAIGNSAFGSSVAISDDGNTLVAGGNSDNSAVGAAWVYTRNGTTWSRQAKLVANDSVGLSFQGYSVAISGDGNTVAVGGMRDNGEVGATWVYSRNGTSWSQIGNKIVANNSIGMAHQGVSVALNSDGSILVVGGSTNNSTYGSVWVYTRSGNSWIQTTQLIPNDRIGTPNFGISVSISADGNTIAVGGSSDNANKGAAWIFTRDGSSWTQQGSKLYSAGNTTQGIGISLSRDGNVVSVSAITDPCNTSVVLTYARQGNTWTHAASIIKPNGNDSKAVPCSGWGDEYPYTALSRDGNVMLYTSFKTVKVFGRNGGDWIQLNELSQANPAFGTISENQSTALSPSGSTAVIGNATDSSNKGAVWIFSP